jgi:hypothetical protein
MGFLTLSLAAASHGHACAFGERVAALSLSSSLETCTADGPGELGAVADERHAPATFGHDFLWGWDTRTRRHDRVQLGLRRRFASAPKSLEGSKLPRVSVYHSMPLKTLIPLNPLGTATINATTRSPA